VLLNLVSVRNSLFGIDRIGSESASLHRLFVDLYSLDLEAGG
jgi:hypothetical protein